MTGASSVAATAVLGGLHHVYAVGSRARGGARRFRLLRDQATRLICALLRPRGSDRLTSLISPAASRPQRPLILGDKWDF